MREAFIYDQETTPIWITSMIASVVDFSNTFIQEKIVTNNFFKLKIKLGLYDYLVCYNPISSVLNLNPQHFFKISSPEINQKQAELIILTIVCHEIGHHIQILFGKTIEESNEEWREDTADYLSGYLLANYLYSKGEILENTDFLFLIPFDKLFLDYRKIMTESLGDTDSFDVEKRIKIIDQGVAEASSLRKMFEFLNV